jgi:hypothetical protein
LLKLKAALVFHGWDKLFSQVVIRDCFAKSKQSPESHVNTAVLLFVESKWRGGVEIQRVDLLQEKMFGCIPLEYEKAIHCPGTSSQ